MKINFTILATLILSTFTLQASDVTIKLPKVPEVPKVEAVVPKVTLITDENHKTNQEILEEVTKEKKVIFSDHVAPELVEEIDAPEQIIEVGDVHNGQVTAYLHAPLMTPKEVSTALANAGFKVLDACKIDKKGLATSIIFTNDAMINAASKTNRGFASVLHVTIDKKNSLISITNPIYMMAAFMQEAYDAKLANETLAALRGAFKELKNSDETLKFRVLERYQFMAGMPKYSDMQVIKQGTNASLIESAKKSKDIVYEIALANGSTILGVTLGSRTTKFIKKTGYQNAGLLPYPVLIENGEAKILDPKYYIAIMYPMLKMSQFMTIATVPGAINKDIYKTFR